MFRKILTTTALVMLGQGAFAGPVTVDDVVAALEGDGFTVREVKSGATRIKVEAIDASGSKVEIVYNKDTGEILKRETSGGNGGSTGGGSTGGGLGDDGHSGSDDGLGGSGDDHGGDDDNGSGHDDNHDGGNHDGGSEGGGDDSGHGDGGDGGHDGGDDHGGNDDD